MASSAPPSDATDGPILSLINERLRALRDKHNRILQMEKSIAQGKPINMEQEDVLRSKPSVLACINEFEKLRPQLSSALQEELSLAAQRLPRDDDTPATPEKGEANNDAVANDGTAGGASSTHSSTEGQGMDTSSGYDYEVFLSFRGPDTRSAFTNFLYTSLIDAGIHTFKDDETLRVGEEFEPKLLQAINESKISIPIFSKGYASSVWCLKELVQMIECRKNGRQKIKPIFYDVAPSEVRHQTDDYAKAFLSHKNKKRHDEKTMQEWKDALSAVGAINGWVLHGKTDRREGEFAKTVTQEVFSELKKANLVISDCLVNVDSDVNAIMRMIGDGRSKTRIIGIHGMGGVGKTTIAKIIYNQLSNSFEHHCFLSNIREVSERKGIECLQHQLISGILKTKWIDIKNIDDGTKTIEDRLSTKKVLLLLDDVDHKKHMDALVGKRSWFGIGSKLIITTRNKEVLEVPEVDDSHKVNPMHYAQSCQLFSKYAFRKDYPLNEYIDQSNRAIGIARGLPLTLEIIGSLLWHTEKEMWDATLKKLESIPHDKVLSKLKISYDALDFRQKRIFLDIACLFIGYDKDILVHFWDESIFFPKEAMKVLQNMSLIKINEDNEVWMHDQLRALGREIVREKSDTKIEKQSRVWDPKEGLNLLRRHKGKKKVEALRLNFDHEGQFRFTYECFESLSNLRFLEVDGWMENFHAKERLLWHESPSNVIPINENSDLLPQLRWLSWHRIPPTFNITNFSMEDVVILDLSRSEITDDWKGWSHMKVMENLKVLDLSSCYRLKRTPNFSAHSNLERLILRDCFNLVKIDGSICQLKRLVSLDVGDCPSLQSLPDKLGRDLASLVYLSLRKCVSLERLPDTIGNLTSLIELDISYTSFKEIPDSIGKLQNLKVVKMLRCGLEKITNAFWTIEKLEEIDGDKEHGTEHFYVNIGSCIYRNQSLRILILYGADIYQLPRLPESLIELQLCYLHMDTFPDLSNLTNLEKLDLIFASRDSHGRSLEDPIPWWIRNLSKLESLSVRFNCDPTSLTGLGPSLPPQLESIRISRLPSSLSYLRLEGYESLYLLDLSNLKKLSSLHIGDSAVSEIQGLSCLENLRDFELHGLGHVEILPDLSNLNKLKSLQVRNCDNLVEIQGELPQFLDGFEIYGCRSLRKLPDLSTLMDKTVVYIDDWSKLNVEAILGFAWKNPQDLHLVGFEQLHVIPDLSNLSNSNELTSLQVRKCGNLVEIQGKLPESLEELVISSCKSLEKLPDLSNLKGLRKVVIEDCKTLNVEAIFGFAWRSQANFWENLQLSGLGQVKILPNLSNSNKLRILRLRNCANLVEIQGELPQSLKELEISSCGSLSKLPHLSNLNRLKKVKINGCGKLNTEAISCICSEKSIKFVGYVP